MLIDFKNADKSLEIGYLINKSINKGCCNLAKRIPVLMHFSGIPVNTAIETVNLTARIFHIAENVFKGSINLLGSPFSRTLRFTVGVIQIGTAIGNTALLPLYIIMLAGRILLKSVEILANPISSYGFQINAYGYSISQIHKRRMVNNDNDVMHKVSFNLSRQNPTEALRLIQEVSHHSKFDKEKLISKIYKSCSNEADVKMAFEAIPGLSDKNVNALKWQLVRSCNSQGNTKQAFEILLSIYLEGTPEIYEKCKNYTLPKQGISAPVHKALTHRDKDRFLCELMDLYIQNKRLDLAGLIIEELWDSSTKKRYLPILAESYIQEGDWDRANRLLDKIKRESDKNAIFESLAQSYFDNQEYDEAIKMLDRISKPTLIKAKIYRDIIAHSLKTNNSSSYSLASKYPEYVDVAELTKYLLNLFAMDSKQDNIQLVVDLIFRIKMPTVDSKNEIFSQLASEFIKEERDLLFTGNVDETLQAIDEMVAHYLDPSKPKRTRAQKAESDSKDTEIAALYKIMYLEILGFDIKKTNGENDKVKISEISDQDIKKAYRKITLSLHPDKNPSPEAAAKLARINDYKARANL